MNTSLIIRARTGLSTVIRSKRSMSGYAPSKYRGYHMDDFPVPTGSWQEGFRKKQAGHNRMLAFGIVFFSATAAVTYQSGLLRLNLTPKLPNE